MNIKIGEYMLRVLDCGVFKLDGGAMFGVVPKTIWNKTNPSDELNRITLGLRPLLIEGRGRKILIDAGIGDKFNDKYREIYGISNSGKSVAEELSRINLSCGDITDIIITHLHFDHCGGFASYDPGGRPELLFKNASIFIQKSHYEVALSPSDRDRASFIKDNIDPIISSPNLKIVEGDVNIFEGVTMKVFNGHTSGMQAVFIESEGESACYLSDLAPTVSHVPIPFIMGYDLRPLVIIDEKKKMFDELIAKGSYAIFEHEHLTPVGKIARNEKGYYFEKVFHQNSQCGDNL